MQYHVLRDSRMVTRINAREVFDPLSGLYFPQHKMLKILMERAGLTRKELHQATKGKLNEKRTASWLSDIFRGDNRHLAMKDIVPVIKALKLKKSDENHYISAFFKAHCDESLHDYIKTYKGDIREKTLKQRIKELEKYIVELTSALYFEQHVKQKTKLKKLEDKINELSSELTDYKTKARPSAPDSKNFNDEEAALIAYMDWEQKYGHYIEELENRAQFDDPWLERMEECESSEVESRFAYLDEIKNWRDAFKELSNVDTKQIELHDFVKVHLPNGFERKLSIFIEESDIFLSANVDNPLSCWSWLESRLEPRPRKYVLISLLNIWKKNNPSYFYKTDEYYEKYFATSYKEQIKLRKHHPLKKAGSFRQFLSYHYELLRKTCPKLYSLLRSKTDLNVINYSHDEVLAFNLYHTFGSSNLSNYTDFFVFYEGHFSSAISEPLFVHELLAKTICHSPLNIEGRSNLSLSDVFHDYGAAEQSYSDVVSFFLDNMPPDPTADEMQCKAETLAQELIRAGYSKSKENRRKELDELIASMEVAEYPPSNKETSASAEKIDQPLSLDELFSLTKNIQTDD